MEKKNHFASKNLFLLFLILVFACGFAIVYYNLSDSLDCNDTDITQAADSNPWTDYTEPFRGSGTSDDPYIIASAENLAYLASDVLSGFSYYEKYFRQTENIDLSDHLWMPIGGLLSANYVRSFSGIYDGNGHTISNVYCARSDYNGLFGSISNATIKNLVKNQLFN